MNAMKASMLYLAGFVLLFLGVLLFLEGNVNGTSSSYGGVVFIGPFPIVFGGGPKGPTLAMVAVVIAVAMILVFYLSVRKGGRGYG